MLEVQDKKMTTCPHCGKVVKKENFCNKCGKKLTNMCAQLAEVRALVTLLPMGPMRLVMQRRYLNYQKWEQIMIALNYSWRGMHKLHSKALEMIIKAKRK